MISQQFYQDHISQVLLPFWRKALDVNNGGVYTCFNNSGTDLLSTDKYTWSQGRFVWLWSRLAEMSQEYPQFGERDTFLMQAKKTVDFLNTHAVLENGNCAFLLTESGEKKESIPGKGFDTSFYADCFVILGFSEYARVARDLEVLENALALYDQIVKRLAKGSIRSEPYPIPEGFTSHSVPMIMLNVSDELARTLESWQHPRTAEINQYVFVYMKEIMDVFYQPDGRIAEILQKEGSAPDLLLCRHANPGHAIESMWFVMRAAARIGELHWSQKAAHAVAKAFELGWDEQYGGLLRFVDQDGGQPKGLKNGDPYEQLILDTWDTKLWWPHSEVLYSTLLSYKLTMDKKFVSIYKQCHEYVFSTFPNPDKQIGEWIQIRNREGQPIEKVVALPVKDPFHILRNFILIVELLAEMESNGENFEAWHS